MAFIELSSLQSCVILGFAVPSDQECIRGGATIHMDSSRIIRKVDTTRMWVHVFKILCFLSSSMNLQYWVCYSYIMFIEIWVKIWTLPIKLFLDNVLVALSCDQSKYCFCRKLMPMDIGLILQLQVCMEGNTILCMCLQPWVVHTLSRFVPYYYYC